MFRITLGMIPAIAVALAVSAMALLAQPSTVDAQSQSASRSFRANWVAPGAEFRVDVSVRNYGPFGQVAETLPAGFTYVRSSLAATEVDVEGQTIRFNLFGVTSFYYVVTAPTTEGEYVFSGLLQNSDRNARAVDRPHTGARRPTAHAGAHTDDISYYAHADTNAYSDAGADGHTYADAYTHAAPDCNANAFAHTDADADRHSIAYSDAHTGADRHADTLANTHADADCDARAGAAGTGDSSPRLDLGCGCPGGLGSNCDRVALVANAWPGWGLATLVACASQVGAGLGRRDRQAAVALRGNDASSG